MKQSQPWKHFLAIYRNHAILSPPMSIVCANVKIEVFKEARQYRVLEYAQTVAAAVENAEYRIPCREPLRLPADIPHVALTTRTRNESPAEAQEECEVSIDSVVLALSTLLTPDLFRTQLFRGWAAGSPTPGKGLWKIVDPILIDGPAVSRSYDGTIARMEREVGEPRRLSLMSRFIRKGLAADVSQEEAFIWLWTALEIFPMAGTPNIKPIAQFLAPYFGRPAHIVKRRLLIGQLCGIRSKLVHEGFLATEVASGISALGRLELVAMAVLRHAAGLQYDGALEAILSGAIATP